MAQYSKHYEDFLPQEKTNFEVNMLANKDGNVVDATHPLPVTNQAVAVDAFGRQRVSNPLTLFDSSHRYRDNNLWNAATTGTSSATFNAAQGLVDLTVNNAINA